jgi:hypothetical protein
VHGDVEQAGVDIAAAAGPARLHHAAQEADDAGKPGERIDDGGTHPCRWPVRLAGQAHQPHLGLHQIVVARPVGTLVVAAIGRDVQAHHRGIDPAEARVVEAERRREMAAQIVHYRLGVAHKRMQLALSFGRFDVERDAALAEIPGLEVVAVIGAEPMRADVSRRVAAGGRMLDLDHIGSELGQKHRAVGCRPILLDGEHPHACERPHGSALRLSHCLAMIRRCISLVPSPMQVSGASR